MASMRFFLLLLMLVTSAAVHQDLRGKTLTFPQSTDADHVTVSVNQKELEALSVCMRVFSDLDSSHGLFLLTTNSSYDFRQNFLVVNGPDFGYYRLLYNNSRASFNLKGRYKINEWQSICSTWDAASGVAQIWTDAKCSSRKFLSESRLMGPMSVILGQVDRPRKDDYTPFVGMVTDLHVWNYTLTQRQIESYGPFTSFPPGNVVNWRSLDFEIHGRILIE